MTANTVEDIRRSMGFDTEAIKRELQRHEAYERGRAAGARSALIVLAYLLTPLVWVAIKLQRKEAK